MNTSSPNSPLGNSVVASIPSHSLNLATGEREVKLHHLTPYARPSTSITNLAGKQIITLKTTSVQRQRPSILRRFGGNSPLIIESTTTTTKTTPTTKSIIVNTISSPVSNNMPQQQPFIPPSDGNYVPRLCSLPKIPAASLRKPGSHTDGNFPSSFTVVLGGIPADLVSRLFSNTNPNTSRIISAQNPISTLQSTINHTAATPAHCLTIPRINQISTRPVYLANENQMLTITTSAPVTSDINNRSGTHSLGSNRITGALEVDESSAAVAELASEEHSVAMVSEEQFDDLEDTIQISSA